MVCIRSLECIDSINKCSFMACCVLSAKNIITNTEKSFKEFKIKVSYRDD